MDDLTKSEYIAEIERLRRENEELRAADAESRNILDELSYGIAITLDGKKFWVNDAFANVFGYSKDELFGKTAEFLIVAEELPLIEERMKQRLKGEDVPADYETRAKTKAGEVIDIQISAKVITYDGKQAIQIIAQDITEQKQAEEKLAITNEFLNQERRLFTSGPVVVFKWKNEEGWPVEYVSPNVIDVLGYTPEELISGDVPYSDIVIEGDLLRVADEVLYYSESGVEQFEHFPYRIRRKNGEVIWVSDYTNIIRDEKGDVVFHLGYIVDVTLRKEAEKAVEDSEAMLRSIIKSAMDAIIVIDDKGLITVFNPAAEKMFLQKAMDMIGNDLDRIMPEEYIADHHVCVPSYFATGKPDNALGMTNYEPGRRSNGEIFPMEIALSAGKHSGGQFVVGIARDITDRSKIETERIANIAYLSDLERLDRELSRGMDIERIMDDAIETVLHIFECDRAWLLYPCAPNADAFTVPFEANVPECPGARHSGKQIPLDEAMREIIIKTLTTNKPVVYDTTSDNVITGLASSRFGVKSQLIMSIHPKIGDAWAFGIHQCSEVRTWTDEEIRLFQEVGARLTIALSNLLLIRNLKESEERFRTVFRTSPDSITISNLSTGSIIDVNLGFEELIGYSREEVIFQSVDTLDIWVDLKEFDMMIRIIQSEGSISNMEAAFRTKSGKIITGLLSGKTIVLDGEECLVVIIRDITERTQAREELERALIELTRSNRELEQFAYVTSHDLQEPLRMVVSYLQLLEKRYADTLDDDATEFIGYAVDGAKRMKELINELLMYSRVSTQGKPFVEINCNKIVDGIVNDLQFQIEESGAIITRDDLPIVNGDRSQIRQLFLNLIGNAIKFNDKAEPTVHVSTSEEDGYYVFNVEDNGIGIESKYFERIFHVFQRLHGVGEYDGTGIGLAICKKIVERHNGTIYVESKKGVGSTFRFTLPDLK